MALALAVERRLVAIVMADVSGYSRLMGEDEPGTLRRLKALRRELLEPLVAEHQGRIVNFPGDSALCEFGSAVQAVSCAAAVQRAMAEREADEPEERKLRLRLGVNLSDVLRYNDDEIYGDGVNVAARIQELAEPGGIAVSRTVRDQARGKLDLDFESMGAHQVKNIKERVEVWRVVLDQPAPSRWRVASRPRRPPAGRKRSPWKRAATAGLALLTCGGMAAATLVTFLAAAKVVPGPDEANAAAAPAVAVAADPARRPSLAVLPFEALDGGGGEVMAAGLAEDILTELSRNRDLRIIARDSSFALAQEGLPPPEAGRRLGVRYIVAGSAWRAGEELRVNVRLVDTVNGEHIWAERYAAQAAEIYATQDEIVRQISGRLSSEVREMEKVAALRRPPGSLDVYELTLRGLALKHRLDRDALIAARDVLTRAVALDPGYAPAQLYLGQVDLVDIGSGGITGRYGMADLDGVVARIRAAVALDPSLPAGYRILNQALSRKGDVEGALQAALRSVELAPSNADNLNFLGVARIRAGLYAEAAADIRTALDLNPVGPAWYHVYLAQALYALDRFGDSVASAEACAVRTPGWIACHLALAAARQAAGRGDEAGASVRQVLRLNPNYTTAIARGLTPYPRDPALARRYLEDLRSAGLPEPVAALDAGAGPEGPAAGVRRDPAAASTH